MNGLAPLIGLAFLSSAAAPAAAAKPLELRFGGEPWHLALALGDLKPSKGADSRPGRQVFTYADGEGTVLSVIVENAHAPATMASCRDVFAERKEQDIDGILPDNEVQGQRGDAATQEYDLKLDFRGKPIVQHNAFSCRVRGSYYIDVHASKTGYRPADHDALITLIDDVAIVE